MLKKTFRIFEVAFFLLALLFAIIAAWFNFSGKLTTDQTGLLLLASVYGLLILYALTTFFVKKAIWNLSAYGAGLLLGFFNLGTVIKGTSSSGLNVFGLMVFIFVIVAIIFRFLEVLVCKEPECELPGEDRRIRQLKEWKEVLDNGFITKEEYEEKRKAILGIRREEKK